jgi:phage-related protein
MEVLPQIILAASERPHGGSWVFLWDLELAKRTRTLPPVVIRITSHHAPLLWPPTTGQTFYPFPFSMSDIEQDNEGNLPSVELTIDNTARTLMRYVHAADGFEGNRATLYLTHADALSTSPPQQLQVDLEVASATASDEAISLRLEMVNLNAKRLPQSRYVQGTCRWKYGGPECSFPITATTSLLTCGKRIVDCIERGEDELARGLPRLHPKRFGAFPGIPTQRA